MCLIRLVFLLSSLQVAVAVLFSTKAILGSTCLHHLESGSTILFDRGQMAQMIMASTCIQITQRGVRFISPVQHIRNGGNGMGHGWHELDCIQNGKRLGSLCAIRSHAPPPPSDPSPGAQESWNEILPCLDLFTPQCGKETNILPLGFRDVLQSVPRETKQCTAAGETSGTRRAKLTHKHRRVDPSGISYDITQCDLHSVGISMVYVNRSSKLYITYGLELTGLLYAVAGICIIVVVACITQSIVHITTNNGNKPNGWVCLVVCAVAWVLVISTMEGFAKNVLVTTEEVFSHWVVVAYCTMRFMVCLGEVPILTNQSTVYNHVKNGDYHNLLVCSLQLLTARIHLTMSTPYTIGITFLLGTRLFWKLQIGATTTPLDPSEISSHWPYVIVADAFMMYLLCLSGVMPLFSNAEEGHAACIVLVFSCISIARVIPNNLMVIPSKEL